MSSVGKISLDLNINSKKFNKQVDGIKNHTTKAFSAMSVAIGNIFANMATEAVKSIGNFVKDSIDKGSELTELENVVESVFTTMADKVDSFAKNALDTYGLTEKQAKKMVGTFGAMSKSFGYSEQQAYNMSTALAGLAGDVASFYNLDVDEAYTKMKSVFTGETETLKELGVVMTQAALDEFALAKGFGKTTAKMSEQEKVALRLAFVQNKLSTAQGDVIRTQDSWANQMRKLKGQIDSFKTAIGQGLINLLTPVIKFINVIIGKLVQLANAFKSFTEMIMGKKSSGGAGAAMKEVADAASDAAGSTGGIEDAANGAAAAAKKAQKSLMGFDEINKLQKNPDDSGAGGGSVNFGEVDFGSEIEAQEEKANPALDKLKDRLKELLDLFKAGLKAGLGDDFEAAIQRIKDHIKSIGESLKEIFTDPAVVEAANRCLDKIAYALGQIVGSFVSIGVSIAEMLIGGIDKYLQQNKDFIKERLIGIFDATGEIFEIAGNLAQAIASIFEVFRGDTAKQCVADFIGIFVNSFLGFQQLFLEIGRDILNCIAKPIIDNKDKIKEAIENTLKPISTVLSTLNQAVKDSFDKIFEVYDAKIRPAFEGIAEGLSSLLSTILDVYNTYIAPVLESLAQKFSDVWASSIQPTINKAIEFIGKLADFISTFWQTVLVPLINWLLTTIAPVLMPIIETIGKVVLDVCGNIIKAIGGIFDILGGLLDFLTGLFKGDWEQCWEGLKSIFEGFCGIIEGLMSALFNVLGGIISAAVEVLAGIFTFLWETVKGIFNTAINAIVSIVSTGFNLIAGVISNIGENIKFFVQTAWDAIKGIITTVVNNIKMVVTTVFNAIKNVVTTVLNAIKSMHTTVWNGIKNITSSAVNAMKTVISSGLNAIKSTFTSVWNSIRSSTSSIFNSIRSTISNVVGSIRSLVKSMANGVIDAVNGMIGALNGLSFSIPSWVPGIGGNSFSMSIPKLPHLAEGGYVRANQPQPVIIGDNRTQGEIVSPEGKMSEVFMETLERFFSKLLDMGYTTEKSGEFGDLVIPIYLDGSILDEVIVTAQQRRDFRSGGK